MQAGAHVAISYAGSAGGAGGEGGRAAALKAALADAGVYGAHDGLQPYATICN